MPLFVLFLALATMPANSIAVLLDDKPSSDDPSGEPMVVIQPNPSVAAHQHAIFIDLGNTPPRQVSVSIELDGALRAVPVMRRLAAAAMVIASAFVTGPAAPAMAPWVTMLAQQIVTPQQRVIIFPGSALKPLGGGTHLLKYRCLHDSPLDPRIRVTVRARGGKRNDPWEVVTPWRSLASPSVMAEHSDE